MGFVIGVLGLAAAAFGFWFDFALHPIRTTAMPEMTSYFDIGAAGIAIAIVGFLFQLISFVFKRAPKAKLTPAGV